MAAGRILLVEDEPAQRQVLAYNLRAEGFEVVEAADGDEALLLLEEEDPDLVLLDWMLPGVSGIEICRRLRARARHRQLPIVMISARGEEADRVRGLETGADDYVTKPYSVAELVARIRAQLRRMRQTQEGRRLAHGDIVLDPDAHRVTAGGKEIHLGPTEFRLLATLLSRPGRVWTREQLLDRVWERSTPIETRTVDVHVGRLRRAIRSAGVADPIRTVRGVGYALG